jgi:hypothetical protein
MRHTQVNSVTQRERHPVAAESDMPVLIPAFLHLGLHNPSRGITAEKVKLPGVNYLGGRIASLSELPK